MAHFFGRSTRLLWIGPKPAVRPSLLMNLNSLRYYSSSSSSGSNEPPAKDTTSEPNSTKTPTSPNNNDYRSNATADAGHGYGLSDAGKILRDLDANIANAAEVSRRFERTAEDAKRRIQAIENRPRPKFVSEREIAREVKEASNKEVAARLKAELDAKKEAEARLRERIDLINGGVGGPISKRLQREAGEDPWKGAIDTGIKLGPTLGRQITVDPSGRGGVGSALRLLNLKLRSNNVRRTVALQRFHVRRGQVRKHMRMLRWRRLFAYSFNHTVRKIQRMRRQGW